MSEVTAALNQLSEVPPDPAAFETWLELNEAFTFLQANAGDDEFVVYASRRFTFIHALLVPSSSVNPPNVSDLMAWNFTPNLSWGVSVKYSEPLSVSLCPSLDHTGSKTLAGGEQLIFQRHFDGHTGPKSYYEILQKFTHAFDLHFLSERNAYCRLDKHGDIEEVIRLVLTPGTLSGISAILFNRRLLDDYLNLTDSAIVRMFDFTRCKPGQFHGWKGGLHELGSAAGDIWFRRQIEPGHASYMRGVQVVRASATKQSLIKRFSFEQFEQHEYASFIALDWRNGVVAEISCAPGKTSDYFTESSLPFELTPAFFKPEVLLKYKADGEKYRLKGRSVSCRAAWSLQTYDVNDADQVHTYLVYLRSLPYEEQLHWKQYNEKPKAPIAQRAFMTDFEGQWDLPYNSLGSLKAAVDQLIAQQVPWWTLRSELLADRLQCVYTTSADEWANEILNLDQFVIEGFEQKWLRAKAELLGRKPEASFASLRLVEECLMGGGFAEEDAKQLVSPLRNAHDLRTKLKGHAVSSSQLVAIKKQVLQQHGSYKKHFSDLCSKCDESLRLISTALKKLQ